jgi:hypothetical protein
MKTIAVLFGVMVGMFAPLLQGEAEQVAAAPPSGDSKPRRVPKVIVIRRDASEQEWLAANEVGRYSYLRMGKVLPVKKGVTRGDRIVVSCQSRLFCGDLGQDLGPQQFTLKTVQGDDRTSWWVVGGDETGTRYGAYRFAEKLGVRFALDEDVLPDEPLGGAWPVLDETGKPRFSLRGLQPFHDFSVGPDWWNLQDYQNVLSQMLAARLEAQGLRPDDPAVIRRLYEGTCLRIMRKTPVDYYWLWTPEIGSVLGAPGWEIVTTTNFERDLVQVQAAAKTVQAPFGLATCGWRLGVPGDPLWMHRQAPKSWPASSINLGCGGAPVEKQYGEMPGRPKWAIGWAEDDGSSGAACCTCLDLQLWVERMFRDSSDAFRYGCEGMLAIHWRTAAIAPNIAALSQAGWNYDGSTIPDAPPALDAFWSDWGRAMFGGGAGAGNLERFDYWINQIGATRARAQTWVLAERLAAKIVKAHAAKDPMEKNDSSASKFFHCGWPWRAAMRRPSRPL